MLRKVADIFPPSNPIPHLEHSTLFVNLTDACPALNMIATIYQIIGCFEHAAPNHLFILVKSFTPTKQPTFPHTHTTALQWDVLLHFILGETAGEATPRLTVRAESPALIIMPRIRELFAHHRPGPHSDTALILEKKKCMD